MFAILNIMNLLIKFIYYILEKLNTESDEKLIKSFSLDGIKVANENGWTDATHIHKTKPFEIYHLELENGMTLDCADEHIVFVNDYEEKWVKDLTTNDKVITNKGLSRIKSVTKTHKIVNMCDLTVSNDRHSYYTNNILSHNTTTSAIFMLHYILFNIDKNALVLGNKRKTAVEILDKAKKIYLELPYFLKPGIYKWNEAEIVLDNGCRLMAEATTINSGISFTFHCVLADEFAHVAPNIIDKFYNNLFPTITAGKARFIITSTQNGYNLFYRLYKAAEAKISEYAAFKTDWYEVPEWNPETKQWEPRDEKWHQLQVANYGSEEAFNAQFGTNFDISAKTLISQKVLAKNKQQLHEFINKDLYGITLSDCYYWHPNYEPMEMLKKEYLVITADLAEGIGGDYTIFLINRMINKGESDDNLECIGYFRSSNHSRDYCTFSLQTLICTYINQEHALLSFEKNTYGELFYRDLMDNMEKDSIISQAFDPSILVKYYNETGSRYAIGIKITPGNKTQYCLLFKNSYERSKYIFDDTMFMTELSNFIDDGSNHYKASFGHDDLVMAAMQTEFVKNTLQYKIMREEYNADSPIIDDKYYNPFEDIKNIMMQENDHLLRLK